ncbi:MAG: RNA methyltransferase [Candidatus Harrisonbacteria bacterium]|nr:RNA methyltransferase [Candidatus Harrisonbacteria bacterium]
MEIRQDKIARIKASRHKDLVVVLEDVHDPHNAAAVLRSCDAFSIGRVYFIFDQEKRYNPGKIGKASSSSANKWLDFEIFPSAEACFASLRAEGFKTFATVLDPEAQSLYETDFRKAKVALVFGNEQRGLSKKAIDLADHKLFIPMQGMVQSLNISVTAAICIFEANRQKKGL